MMHQDKPPGLGGVTATTTYLDLIEGVREARGMAQRKRQAKIMLEAAELERYGSWCSTRLCTREWTLLPQLQRLKPSMRVI
jgi:hypothetical protein